MGYDFALAPLAPDRIEHRFWTCRSFSNSSGNYNSASGYSALHNKTTGTQNSAAGYQALYGNKTGGGNTASGLEALYHNTDGHYNIAEGYKAGFNLTTGSYNIDIGSLGVAGESGVIRIGTSAQQTQVFIAGIDNSTVTSSASTSAAGQLGVKHGLIDFKTAITPMGSDTSSWDSSPRPSTFKLKSDAKGTRQYGLIAEEVAKVYPELVILDQSGRIVGVRYDELAPMLLSGCKGSSSMRPWPPRCASWRPLRLRRHALHAAVLALQPTVAAK